MHARNTRISRELTKDAESERMEFPAEYMFKDVPDQLEEEENPVDVTLSAMDKHGIEMGLVGLGNPAHVRHFDAIRIASLRVLRSIQTTLARQCKISGPLMPSTALLRSRHSLLDAIRRFQ